MNEINELMAEINKRLTQRHDTPPNRISINTNHTTYHNLLKQLQDQLKLSYEDAKGLLTPETYPNPNNITLIDLYTKLNDIKQRRCCC